MLTLFLKTRNGRAALACFGLGAYLLTTGAPLIHAAAHGAHEERGLVGPGDERIAHGHDENHHASLHAACVMPTRGSAKVAVPEPQVRIEIMPPLPERHNPSQPERVLASRAPPPGDPARAPPHV